MAASGKFDASLGSSDRPLYAPGQRGYTASTLDRSGSFRESTENTFLSPLPNTSRSSSVVTQGDVINFFQCLPFDPKKLVEHKFNRQLDFKRLTCGALGISLDDSLSSSLKGKLVPLPSPEEFKLLKAGLYEVSTKARERVKVFNKALSVINKYFPSIPSRKRSRLDVLSSERSNAIFSSDKSVSGTGIGKMGIQSHTSGFDLEQQKSEERIKSTIQNKRTRTSMMDIRVSTPVRPSGDVDKDREVVRLPNGGAVHSEDRTLAVGVDGWEKSKMKKKRSGIKPDVAPSGVEKRPNDGCRDTKQGLQPSLLCDGRSRLNDSQGFRSRVANAAVSVGKVNGTSEQTGFGVHSSIPRPDQDNNTFVHDRRELPTIPDKERLNLKAVNNRVNAREDLTAGSPTSSTKINAPARAPRTNSHLVPKSSPVVQRANLTTDWELSHCTTNLPVASGTNHRKRTSSAQSSSPPVARWVGQRPQKNSRTARRTNFVPVVSNNDEIPALDVGRNESGLGIGRCWDGNSPQPIKLKSDRFSSVTLSESEESGAAEINSREKCKKSDEIEGKAAQNIQKVSTLVLPTRKNKVANGADLGDNIRRQGRSGRGFTSTRSLMPMTDEKLANVGTAKQLRNARLSFDKAESKAGRPPARKLSDRKAYTRQRHTTINAAADFLDDGHEDLQAAVNAVINSVHASFGSFWKQMEPFFRFISDWDIAYLRQQGNLGSDMLGSDGYSAFYNDFGFYEPGRDANETESGELCPKHLTSGVRTNVKVSLYQILLAAIIPEAENEEIYFSGSEHPNSVVHGSLFGIGNDPKSDPANYLSTRNFELAGHATSNGYITNACGSGRIYNELEQNVPDNDIMFLPDSRTAKNFQNSDIDLFQDKAMLPYTEYSGYQYNNMSLNERIILEIQSIGLYQNHEPDLVQSEGEEISGFISSLEDKYHEQVSTKRGLLDKLLKCATETRALQEKELELRAFDKLVVMAYEKYMTFWGPNAHGGKSANSRMAKQAALTYVKRTLNRCHEFERGKSCFNEPLFKGMFLSATTSPTDAQTIDANTDGESGKFYVNASGCSIEIRGPLGSQQSPSSNNHDICSDAHLSVNLCSVGREDSGVKKELLLDDLGATSGIASSLSSSAKGKRSERDWEGKGKSREVVSKNGTAKIGRQASGNVKGERKSKTKPKQKLSASTTGLFGKIPEQPKATLSLLKSSDITAEGNSQEKDEFSLDVLDDPAIDLSDVPLPGMDVLGVPDDLGDQGEDLGSWLNIDDDGLQDHDFMGLEIPMDDLSELNMMV